MPEDSSWIDKIYLEADEWPNDKYVRDDEVLHIELRKWADIMLIAPVSANTMAKLAYGICDNLLTSVARAWDKSRPFILAPAMNTHMWEDIITQEHIELIGKRYNLKLINPIEKNLACGDKGMGAMASIETIVNFIS